MPRSLTEQVVVVTGASSGIGRATAEAFGRHGATVVLTARDAAALEQTARNVERQGGSALVIPGDVTIAADVERVAAETVARFQRIDTWVNNAGIAARAPFLTLRPEEIERLMRVNYLGAVYGMHAACAQFRRQGYGTLINVSSLTAIRGMPGRAAYSASKKALEGYAEAIRLELAREHPGIAVCTIVPDHVRTQLERNQLQRGSPSTRHLTPGLEPGLVARAIVHAAEHPRRDIHVGVGRLYRWTNAIAPAALDRLMLAATGRTAVAPAEPLLTAPPTTSPPVDSQAGEPAAARRSASWLIELALAVELHPWRALAALLTMIALPPLSRAARAARKRRHERASAKPATGK